MDDTWLQPKPLEIEAFSEHIKSVDNNIKFTREDTKENWLLFFVCAFLCSRRRKRASTLSYTRNLYTQTGIYSLTPTTHWTHTCIYMYVCILGWLNKCSTGPYRTSSSGQDSAAQLHLKEKGHSFDNNSVHFWTEKTNGLRKGWKSLSLSKWKTLIKQGWWTKTPIIRHLQSSPDVPSQTF